MLRQLKETLTTLLDTLVSKTVKNVKRAIKAQTSVSCERQPEVDFFPLTRFDTIASVMASHQKSKQEFSSPRMQSK